MQVVVGRVGRAHGIRGEVSVEVRTDEPERRFAPGAQLRLGDIGDRSLIVTRARSQGARLLVSFAGVGDRTAAESLRGTLLSAEVDGTERPDDPDEFFDHQLTGLQAVTTAGAPVGEVTEVVHLPAQDLLVISRANTDDALVPFVAELVPEVDLAAGRLVIADRPGLLTDQPDEG